MRSYFSERRRTSHTSCAIKELFFETHPFTSSNFHVIVLSQMRLCAYIIHYYVLSILKLQVLLNVNFFFWCTINSSLVILFIWFYLTWANIFVKSKNLVKVLSFLISLCNSLLNLFLTSEISIGTRYVRRCNVAKINVSKIFMVLF